MQHELGELVKTAREARGWDQAELARRIGVGQQAVSNWERGTSRPRKDLIPKLAELLDIDPPDLRKVIDRRTDSDNAVAAPPLKQNLPLNDLSPDRFEHFVTTLVQLRHPDWIVSRYGRLGDDDRGVDVIAERGNRVVATYQCKRVNTFGPEKVRQAVQAVKIEADQHHLVLSRPASPRAIDEIRLHKNWQLWGADEISHIVRFDLDRDAAMRLLDSYFPGLRAPFLGVDEPSPWLKIEDYFAPFGAGQPFSHEWPLTGRESVLEEVRSFLAEEDGVGVLIGRGGIGKSRLLYEAASTTSVAVRMMAGSTPVRPEHFELLPADEHIVIVVDDAHDRDDITDIVAGVRRTRPSAKFLLATRPYGVPHLKTQLRRAGTDIGDNAQWDLPDLNVSEARKLARQVAGPGADRLAVDRLGSLTTDCPLVTVYGAQLIASGKLTAADLETNEAIRDQILRAFRDALTADPHTADPGDRREILDALSILQPFRLSDPEFHSAMEQLTGITFHRAKHHLNALEEAGVLLRRASSLRIVPDLLGDIILSDACLDTASGTTTGFAEQARNAATGRPLEHVFINASRLDWQFGRERRTSLVAELWDDLEARLRSSAIAERRKLLELVKKVAIFQPDRALRVARWVIDSPTDRLSNEDDPLIEHYRHLGMVRYDNVVHDLGPILRQVAYDGDYLSDAMDLLWQLAQDNDSPRNQDPDHPIRVLQDIAQYEVDKPLGYNDAAIDVVGRWFDDPSVNDSRYSPFDVLEPLLATEGMSSQPVDTHTIGITRFSINSSAVRTIRSRVVDLASEEARSSDPRRAVRAVKAIGTGLRYPSTAGAQEADWTPVLVGEMERLGELAQDETIDPVVSVAIRRAVWWHATYSKTDTRAAAREVIDRLPTSIAHELGLVLYDGWGLLLHDELGDHRSAEQATQRHFSDVSERLINETDLDERLAMLDEQLATHKAAFDEADGNPEPFVQTHLYKDFELAQRICDHVEHNPDAALREVLSVALAFLLQRDRGQGLSHAERLLATGSEIVARQVADTFGRRSRDRTALIDGERSLLQILLTHDDPFVRQLAIWAIPRFTQDHRTLASDLAAEVRIEDSAAVAEELFTVIGRHGSISLSDMPPESIARILNRLTQCPEIDGYHVTAALSDLSEIAPEDIVKLLQDRVEHAEKTSTPGHSFDPLPHHWHNELKVHNHPRRDALLRQVRDWIAHHPQPARLRLGGELFRAVCGTFDDAAIEILDEAIRSGSQDQIQALEGILRSAPRSVAWTHADFIAHALAAAHVHGEEHVRRIGGAIHSAVSTGVRHGTPGEPFSEDIEQRDRANKIAAGLPRGSLEQRLYRSLADTAERSIEWSREDDLDLLDRRDW